MEELGRAIAWKSIMHLQNQNIHGCITKVKTVQCHVATTGIITFLLNEVFFLPRHQSILCCKQKLGWIRRQHRQHETLSWCINSCQMMAFLSFQEYFIREKKNDYRIIKGHIDWFYLIMLLNTKVVLILQDLFLIWKNFWTHFWGKHQVLS